MGKEKLAKKARKGKKKKRGGIISFLIKVIIVLLITIILLVLFAKFGADGSLKDTIGGIPIVKDITDMIDDIDEQQETMNTEEGIVVSIAEEKIMVNGKDTTKDELLSTLKELVKEDQKINLIDDGAKHIFYQDTLELLKENGYIVIETVK